MLRFLLSVPLVLSLLFVQSDHPLAAVEKTPSESDDIIPLASGINDWKTELELDGQKIGVTLTYAQKGGTVYVLPTWHVRAVRRLADDSPAVSLKPSDPVFDPEAKGEQKLEFDVVDLLEIEVVEKAIQDKLKARIAQRSGQPADKLAIAFAVPQIKTQSYRFTLIGSGSGDATLPAVVPISPDFERRPNGRVRLTLQMPALKAVEKENGGFLKLADTHLRVVGLMRVRFEDTQVIAQVDFIRGAMTELRKSVSSIKDSQGRTPEVFVELPEGGAAKSDNQIRLLAQQSLSVTISARKDADTAPILSLVQAELNGLIERSKTTVAEQEKRVAILLDKQVTLSATMGEIHKLAKLDEKQRDDAFKAASEDYQARSNGKSSNYSGSVSLNVLGYAGGSIGGSYGNSSNESQEARTKREVETMRKQFDRVMKEFQGKIPTLTGISLDETSSEKSFEQVSKNFEGKKLTTGDSLHRWPLISLGGQLESTLSPQDLVRQYAILKADHEALQKLLGTPQQLAETKANIERLAKLTEELRQKSAAFDAALAKVDQTALVKLTKEFADLKRRLEISDDEPKPGEEREFEIFKGVKMRFCWVPAGKETLGSPVDEQHRSVDEKEHVFETKGFWLGKYEVTQAQWEAVMGENPSNVKGPKLPVETVSWEDCQKFSDKCGMKKLKIKLPHEDEWEYACRGGKGNKQAFYLGNKLTDKQANIENAKKQTTEVGSYEKEAPHPWGLCDMHGNVSEWCENKYSDSSQSRVVRGGSWNTSPRDCRSADRNVISPVYHHDYVGFRVRLVLD